MPILTWLLGQLTGVGTLLSGVGTFLSPVFAFIGQHWRGFLIAGLLAFIWYQNYSSVRWLVWINTIPSMQQNINKDNNTIKILHTQLNQVIATNEKLTLTIDAYNTTIQKWADISKQLEKENVQLQIQLKNQQIQNNIKIQNILNAPTPTTCKASINYLRTQILNITW